MRMGHNTCGEPRLVAGISGYSPMLLDKIVELATDNQQPLTVLLRQCIVLAYEVKNEQLKEWANHELNGYSDQTKVPEYRTVRAGATGTFNAGYMFPTIKRPIPAGA